MTRDEFRAGVADMISAKSDFTGFLAEVESIASELREHDVMMALHVTNIVSAFKELRTYAESRVER